ncbi:invertase inhibitor [Salix suchowensis]|nr:invertase inhibitor [Salix suchowensis]
MGSFHGHIPFFFVVVLVLSSNHILVDAHNDTTSRIKPHQHVTQNFQLVHRRCLTGCSTNYEDAVGLITKSLAALDARDYALECKRYGDARAWVGAAIKWSETCEGVLAGKSNKKSPLTPMKSEFTKQAALALSVIYKLAGNNLKRLLRTNLPQEMFLKIK